MNLRPTDYETVALTSELHRQCYIQVMCDQGHLSISVFKTCLSVDNKLLDSPLKRVHIEARDWDETLISATHELAKAGHGGIPLASKSRLIEEADPSI